MDNIKNDVIEEVVEIDDTQETEVNQVKIANDVVATIAGVAASEIKGVAGMCTSFAGGIAEKLGAKKNIAKGIKVTEIEKNTVAIDLFVIVEFGVRIPELAWEIQENVKNSVETMTGMSVEAVNIHVDGISFKKVNEDEAAQNEEAESTDAEENISEEIVIEEVELEEIPEDGSEEL